MTDVQWGSLRPILQEMADRIERMEQFLAASGYQGPNRPVSGLGSFDAVPASFGADPFVSPAATTGQMAAAAHGIDLGGNPDLSGGGVPQHLIDMVRSNRKIEAIKEYRRLTGASLAQAKHVMDQYG